MNLTGTEVKGDIIAGESWLKAHERLIIVFLLVIASYFTFNHWLNAKATNDKDKVTLAQKQLDDQKAKDTALAVQVQQTAGQYQALVVQLSAQNAQLASAVSNRTVVLQQQQAINKTLPLPDLGNRWAGLAGIAPGDITASTAGVTVTDTGARQTVDQLEQVPVLKANLADTQTVVTNKQAEIDKADELITGLHVQVGSLQTTVATSDKTCDTKLQAAASAARKSKFGWFKGGFIAGNITGFIGGLFVGKHL